MSVENFLDTNVFVYLFDETDDFKRGIAERLVHGALRNNTSCISFQVAQETKKGITWDMPLAVFQQFHRMFDEQGRSIEATPDA